MGKTELVVVCNVCRAQPIIDNDGLSETELNFFIRDHFNCRHPALKALIRANNILVEITDTNCDDSVRRVIFETINEIDAVLAKAKKAGE